MLESLVKIEGISSNEHISLHDPFLLPIIFLYLFSHDCFRWYMQDFANRSAVSGTEFFQSFNILCPKI